MSYRIPSFLSAILQEHGADALVGEHLNEDGMGDPPVDNMVRRTPRRTASTQQSIFGIMPPEMTPRFFRLCTSLTRTTEMRESSFSLSSNRPRTSVISTSFSAASDAAICAAAMSALML